MTSHTEKQELAEHFLACLLNRNWDLLRSIMTDDIIGSLPGNSVISGDQEPAVGNHLCDEDKLPCRSGHDRSSFPTHAGPKTRLLRRLRFRQCALGSRRCTAANNVTAL
jgi:hypothetical protein